MGYLSLVITPTPYVLYNSGYIMRRSIKLLCRGYELGNIGLLAGEILREVFAALVEMRELITMPEARSVYLRNQCKY